MKEGSMAQGGLALASRLRQWREGKGHTLEEVGGLRGLGPAYLSRVECGIRRLRTEKKVAMPRRLGVKVADLFDVESLVGRAAS